MKSFSCWRRTYRRHLPLCWPEDAGGLAEASRANRAYVAGQYGAEPPDLHPDHDHRRPWKRALFMDLVGVVDRHRREGLFSDECLLVVFCADPSTTMMRWIVEGAEHLNRPPVFEKRCRVVGVPASARP